MFNICVNFKDTKILKSSVYFQSLYDTLHIVYQLSEIKDHIQGIYLFECVLGHPCNKFKKTRRPMCSAVDHAKFTIHKTISAPNVAPHVSPPLTASTRGEQRQLALECRDVNTSDRKLLTPSYCHRCLL